MVPPPSAISHRLASAAHQLGARTRTRDYVIRDNAQQGSQKQTGSDAKGGRKSDSHSGPFSSCPSLPYRGNRGNPQRRPYNDKRMRAYQSNVKMERVDNLFAKESASSDAGTPWKLFVYAAFFLPLLFFGTV